MRRHMQNISFLAIIATLMSCAFFFSQKNNNSDDTASVQSGVANVSQVESAVDVPDCSDDSIEDQEACLVRAVKASQSLLDTKLEDILALTTDSDLRIKLVESQINWEDSRDADCDLIVGLSADADQEVINEQTCLRDSNLERLEYLNQLYCDIDSDATCTSEEGN
ncbi:MAG: DUF1311 domain-containing protein [Anaerolineaceae bacterium]|nr:DUF1311 domain-containing protein [Anaerolineaceae bacterium]